MQPESPNGLWQSLGYTVERSDKGRRTIRNTKGEVVAIHKLEGEDRHAAEIRTAKALHHFPHGEAECNAVQLHLL